MTDHAPSPTKPVDLLQTMDAQVWAKDFMQRWGDKPGYIDESLMLAWFANAIMCGYDHARWKLEAENERLVKDLLRNQLGWDTAVDSMREIAEKSDALQAKLMRMGKDLDFWENECLALKEALGSKPALQEQLEKSWRDAEIRNDTLQAKLAEMTARAEAAEAGLVQLETELKAKSWGKLPTLSDYGRDDDLDD